MIEVSTVSYADGSDPLNGLVAVDTSKSGKRPAIIVFHEVWGLGNHPRQRINMLAELGYIAFAADIFGDGQVLRGKPDDMPQARARLAKFQHTPLSRSRALAAYEGLKAIPDVDMTRVGAIGYCMGGTCMLELVRSGADLKGAVAFHAELDPRGDTKAGTIKPKILICTGEEDPLVPASQVRAFEREMSGAQADWQVITYGNVGHAFTNVETPDNILKGFSYDRAADRRSWIAMRNFFDEVFA